MNELIPPGDQGEVSGGPEGDVFTPAFGPVADECSWRRVFGSKNPGSEGKQAGFWMILAVFGKALAECGIHFGG